MRNEPDRDEPVVFESGHCSIAIERPAPAVVIVRFEGRDVGELGDAPFRELEKDLARHTPIELFIDAGRGRGASVDVSGQWAAWLRAHREQLRHVSMLTGSRFIQLSADLVKQFAGLGERMRIYTDPLVFSGALAHATANALFVG